MLSRKIISFATGSARSFFRKGDFFDSRAIVPSTELLNKFEAISRPLLLMKGHNIKANVELELLRDTLLPKLLSGEIDLSKIKIEESY